MSEENTLFQRPISKRLIIAAFIAVVIICSLWYFSSKSAKVVEAQALTSGVQIIIEGSETPVLGEWQTTGTGGYDLWSYKDFGMDADGQSYEKLIFCTKRFFWFQVLINPPMQEEPTNPGPPWPIFFPPIQQPVSPPVPPLQGPEARSDDPQIASLSLNGLLAQSEIDSATDDPNQEPKYEWQRDSATDCHDLNVYPNLENNLDDRPNYLDSLSPRSWPDRSRSESPTWLTATNPVVWPQTPSRTEILEQEPYLLLGHTPENGLGFKNWELELNLWLPADADEVTLKTDDICDGSSRDYSGTDADFSISIKGTQKQSIIDDDKNNCSDPEYKITDIENIAGEPLERRSLTTLVNGIAQENPYKLYKIMANINKVDDENESYANQFRISVEVPVNGYLGVGKTEESEGGGGYQAKTALSTSNRLPDAYDRLEVFWETDIYLAADASKGCLGAEEKRIGLYDSDYPETELWRKFKEMNPYIEVSSVHRNRFLNGDPNEVFKKVGNPLEFDGKENGILVHQNAWEYVDFEFEFDKIYKLKLKNLDQKTWIQIGLPYDQINILQQCVDKPLVKVYHGDVSAGGSFGEGNSFRACSNIDLTPGSNNQGNIYAHAFKDYFGSSAEYGVYARGQIEDFYSGYKRGPPDQPPSPANQLTFANSASLGDGNLGGEVRCMPNYWRRAGQLDADDADEVNINELNNDDELLYKPAGNLLTLKSSALTPIVDLDLKATIYVEGNLLIKTDIINKNEHLSKLNQIKLIYLIVKGDILIDPDVTRIDAVLVAMPEDELNLKGRIYTCYIPGISDNSISGSNLKYDLELDLEKLQGAIQGAINDNGGSSTGLNQLVENLQYAAQCIKQLQINGALIAQRIHLGRVTSSKRGSTPVVDGTYPVSEEINLYPEYFIGIPRLPIYYEWLYSSDSITVLPINF